MGEEVIDALPTVSIVLVVVVRGLINDPAIVEHARVINHAGAQVVPGRI